MKKILTLEENNENPFAFSIGDLMAGLLLIFVLLLTSSLLKWKSEQKLLAEQSLLLKDKIYEDLYKEFKNDLKKWNAEIDKPTLSVRFKEPDVLFEQGKYELRARFKEILDDFFPRYVKLLNRKYKNHIEEIRIEGHTSSEWRIDVPEEDAYFYNMELSQDRTRSTLVYVLNTTRDTSLRNWTKYKITANGLSSMKLRYNKDGTENKELSRRVEFSLRTSLAEETVKKFRDLEK